MKLRTILLFAAIGLIVSSPALLKKIRSGGGFESLPFADQDASRQYSEYPVQQSDGSWSPGSPYQFAGSRSSPPVTTMGNNVATASPMSHQPGVTYSEPVYYAFVSLSEFLRFDVSPVWVKMRWPRVSMLQGEDNLTGMRVALVSGPRPLDIHGSLTYYFDQQQRVQRIGFKGWTGDARELVQTVRQFGLTQQKTKGAGLFSLRSWGKLKGVMRLDHPPVIHRELANEQLMVLMEISNPRSSLGVSRQTTAIVDAMR